MNPAEIMNLAGAVHAGMHVRRKAERLFEWHADGNGYPI